jgi:uncharacterized membrane protein
MAKEGRVHGFDVIRGFSVISMMAFHACYDIAYIYGHDLGWFKPPFQDIWRASISWVFLLVAGIMCSYSRNNLKRAGKYLLVAALIWIATTVAAVDAPISFGIIYCMGASTLIVWALEKLGLFPKSKQSTWALAAIALAAFLLCLQLPSGRFGLGAFGGPSVRIPSEPYDSGVLSWLGFPGPAFESGDYYTPLPFSLIFIVGACLGKLCVQYGAPSWLRKLNAAPLEWAGKHALEIYIIHQPVVLVVCQLIFG